MKADVCGGDTHHRLDFIGKMNLITFSLMQDWEMLGVLLPSATIRERLASKNWDLICCR
jgi:hypothetical protein